MLTMFAMVLAIGLLVDDAIVVVENVERVMDEERLSPLEATRKSMDQITGALVGIATVLSAVFLPMAFLSGSTGVIYRQFSVTIVAAMVLSVLVALMLTPALCATLLQARSTRAGTAPMRGFFGWFNRLSSTHQPIATSTRWRAWCGTPARNLLIFAGIARVMGLLFIRLPTSFLPAEDQGFLFALVQAPVGATCEPHLKVLDQVQDHFLSTRRRRSSRSSPCRASASAAPARTSASASSCSRTGTSGRAPEHSVAAVAGRAWGPFSQIKDGLVFPIVPPAVTELGTAGGLRFLPAGRGRPGPRGADRRAQPAARARGARTSGCAACAPNGSEDSPQYRLDIDAEPSQRARRVDGPTSTTRWRSPGAAATSTTSSTVASSSACTCRATRRSACSRRTSTAGTCASDSGSMVPVSAFSSSHWEYGSPQLERFNARLGGRDQRRGRAGVVSGAAMQAIDEIVAKLPPGFGVDWTGQSYQERAAGAQTPMLYALSLIVVFLCLAALYESWAMPTPILLAVPLGVIGAVLATALRGLERDVYFQVGMLTTIGLASKNAILIVEFAKLNMDAGMDIIEATLHAVRDRLRPIVMTSLAFGFGVLPLALATGAGAGRAARDRHRRLRWHDRRHGVRRAVRAGTVRVGAAPGGEARIARRGPARAAAPAASRPAGVAFMHSASGLGSCAD